MRKFIMAAAVLPVLAGCASIFNGQTQAITIRSEPEGAAVTVKNRAGDKVHDGTTPVTLTLRRGAGYFKSESYTIVMAKSGFTNKEVTITGSVNGWYVGNILFGGLIGMLAVDPATGAMYSFPDTVTETLQTAKAADAGSALTIVSTASLTAEQMKQARLLVAAP